MYRFKFCCLPVRVRFIPAHLPWKAVGTPCGCMTCLDEVCAEDDMMVFAVDGVCPSPETVKDATYRYHPQGCTSHRSNKLLKVVHEWLGHSDMRMTADIYPQLDTARKTISPNLSQEDSAVMC